MLGCISWNVVEQGENLQNMAPATLVGIGVG